MQAYFSLRGRLAKAYPDAADWRRVASDSGVDSEGIVLGGGSSINAWSAILKELRTRGRLKGLREVLMREYPDVVDLADQYATDVERGEGDLPDLPALQSVGLNEQDLEAARSDGSLNFFETLPHPLFAMSLSAERLTLDQIDGALLGRNTAAAKARLRQLRDLRSRELAALQRQQSAVVSRFSELELKISSIEKATRPIEPTLPTLPTLPMLPMLLIMTDETAAQQQIWLKRYRTVMEDYQAAVARYTADRAQLGSLRTEATKVGHESSQLVSTIAAQQANAQAEEHLLLADIAEARDKDLLLELRRALDNASVTFGAGNAFKGFWTLLGVNALLDRLRWVFNQLAASTDADQSVARSAETLTGSIESELPAIAKGCLAGAALLGQALKANETTLLALSERFSKLPMVELESRFRRARALLDAEIPAIPDYAKLEHPDDIHRVLAHLTDMRFFTIGQIACVKAEIYSEPAWLQQEVGSAQVYAASAIDAITAVGARNRDLVPQQEVLWTLIRRASISPNLPVFVRTLCAALPSEVDRRFDTTIEWLTTAARESEFGLKDAQALLKEHVLTAYIASREGLQRRLKDSEKDLGGIDAAVVDAGEQIGRVAAQYRGKVMIAAVLSSVPAIGLPASLWARGAVNRLKPLVASDEAPYVALGQFALVALTWATVAAGLVAASATAFSALFYRDCFLDMSCGMTVGSVTVACHAGFLVSLNSALNLRAFLRERDQVPSAPAS